MLKIVLSANEPSGDLLAAALLQALRRWGPVEATGLCGPAMRAAGVLPVANLEDTVAMGFVEVIRKLAPLRVARDRLRAAIAGDCAAFVGVDAPDLHLPLAAEARAAGRLAVQWVAPQVWAWRPGRAARVISQVDLLLCLFDFEPALFTAAAGPGAGRASWTGHPVVDRIGVQPRPAQSAPFLALCPGSRPDELRRHWGPFLEAGRAAQALQPGLQLGVLAPTGAPLPPLPDDLRRWTAVTDLRGAQAALTKSGTITLELALMGVPMVVAHRVHPLSYALARLLVRGVQNISLPNILAGAEVVPERVQRWSADELAALLAAAPGQAPPPLRALGPPGAADRAAELIWSAVRARGQIAAIAAAPPTASG